MAFGAAACNHSNRATQQQESGAGSNVMTASHDSAARDSLLFPLQFTYTDDVHERLSDAHASDQYDPVLELQKIQHALGSLSEAEVQLAQAVQEAKASSILTTGSVDLWAVGSYLRSKYGYLMVLRKANVSKRPKAYLRQLRHDFLVVRGLPTLEGLDILVDLSFRDNFRVAHTTSWYSKLLAALPQEWVGTAAALAPIVGLMSAGIRLCFRQAGIPLPPWREGRAMLSKWVTELHSDEQLPVVPLPDPALSRLLAPYHTPFRTAVRQAGVTPSSAPGAAASAAYKLAGWDKQPQQAAQSVTGAALKKAVLPPLAPVASNNAAAAAAVAAAAAAVVKPAHHAADAPAHNPHHHQVDVPRRIIMGFPVASPPAAAQHQQQHQLLFDKSACAAFDAAAAAGYSGSGGGCAVDAAAAAKLLQHQQQQADIHAMQQPVPLPSSSQAAAGEAQAPPGATCSSTGVAVKAGPALAELAPGAQHGSKASTHSTTAAAAANQNAAAAAAPRPAFTSAAGVVVATAGGTSPGIVINKQWVQQLTEAALASGLEKGRAAGAAAGAAGDVCGGKPGADSKPAAVARQYKSLDQLLPRMRTVKLGAG